LDIAFLHSDALVVQKDQKENKASPASFSPILRELDSENFFKEIKKALSSRLNKQFSILNGHLNVKTLPQILFLKPKILVIECQSSRDTNSDSCNLWFEDDQKPSVVK
jgi:hypothetical protein